MFSRRTLLEFLGLGAVVGVTGAASEATATQATEIVSVPKRQAVTITLPDVRSWSGGTIFLHPSESVTIVPYEDQWLVADEPRRRERI